MTHVIHARNVNSALFEGLSWLHEQGVESRSRNGTVLVSPMPVVTEYLKPNERVLFNATRDANPFFHLMESLWMLAGRNDVRFPAYYASNIAGFSDDGVTIAGAYGERWRSRFGYDQIKMIVDELKVNSESRRCVLTMWQPNKDGYGWGEAEIEKLVVRGDPFLAMEGGKDVPCNTHVYVDTLGGRLNITVCCRSNDLVWGCYGANAVHFSVLHEYLALATDIPQGIYRQFSNNYHIYSDRVDVQRLHGVSGPLPDLVDDRYEDPLMQPFPLINSSVTSWEADMKLFFSEWKEGQMMHSNIYLDEFWAGVVVPLVNAHHAYKAGELDTAIMLARQCIADDWAIAAVEWLERRQARAKNKKEI